MLRADLAGDIVVSAIVFCGCGSGRIEPAEPEGLRL
jgi:hypothetical protein